MKYRTPELKLLGTLSGLTLGQNGSCLDGGGLNITQYGGGAIGDPTGKNSCGASG